MTPPTPTDLRVRGASEPTLPADRPPRFAWRLPAPDWGDAQAAYRIRVADSPDALDDPLWDSGRVEDAATTDVPYDGPALAPDGRYWWTVEVWNDRGERSATADPVAFWTAPETPWGGTWIGADADPGDTNGFRTAFLDPEDHGEPWVAVDLGEPTRVEGVELHPAEPFGGPTTPDGEVLTAQDTEETYHDTTVAQGPVAFGFPEGYRVEVAPTPDFDDPTVLAEGTDVPDPRREPVAHDADARARHVRVVATDPQVVGGSVDDRLQVEYDPWAVFALAALVVRGQDGDDVARGRPVSAASSVESESRGTAHLTNGATTSQFGPGSPRLRREVDIDGTVERARVDVAGLGYGELYANGERVGDARLDPGWTDFSERVLFRTHDVTEHLERGPNALGLWLGRGWFGKPVRQWPGVGSPRALLRLVVEYADGRTETWTTDESWDWAPSPVMENDVYHGETYDAQREQPGWASPGFDGDWDAAAERTAPGGELVPQHVEPVRETERVAAVAVHDHPDGPIVDVGQNLAGWVELRVRGADRGDEVVLKHAEALNDDGSLQTVDLRTAEATDVYVARGDDVETYAPRFTYHGFRYVQVEGYPGDLDPADVTAVAVHTDLEDAGSYACSDDDLNAVQSNARWGLRSNAHSVPTDCPQRDERQGFTGDAHIAADALAYNFDTGRFHGKFVRDHVDAQSPAGAVPSKAPHGSQPALTDPTWTYSLLALPWTTYCHGASARQLSAHYDAFTDYVDFWHGVEDGPLLGERHSAYGDWVALENNDGRRGLPMELFTDAYHYRATDRMADVAAVLGRDEDAERYRALADDVAAAFTDRYFDADAASYADTQAANAVPLALGLVPDGHESSVAETLADRVRAADGHLQTGFLGTPALLDALTRFGHAELAYEVASASEFPGWVYQLRQGATTVWERWDTDEQVGSRMNSRNHSPFPCVSAWFYEGVAGIRVSAALPEERRVDVTPGRIAALDWAEATVETPQGPVATRWERDGDLTVDLEVPWNLTAAVHLPAEPTVDGEAADAAAAVRDVRPSARGTTVEVGPGDHSLRVPTDRP